MTGIVVAVISSGLLSTIITAVIGQYNRAVDAKNGHTEALRLIIKDRLRYLCIHYIEQDWIYEDELEDVLAMHKIYHDTLKGNGYLDVMIDKVKHLAVRGVGR